MSAYVREIADLLIRWVHLIAGIMWIGNSMLFNWLDRNLEKEDGTRSDGLEGRIWMVHSGGFYDVVKKQLEPGQLPPRLHWFMWQNFTTWASGIFLLMVVYYMGGAALLIDPSVRALHPHVAITIGVGAIVGSWAVYDVLAKVLKDKPAVLAAVGLPLLGGLAYALTHLFSGRAAYIHIGVILGTIMTGNVWMVIIPSQRELVAATKEGRAQDASLGKKAKQRSIHNNYITFPLLFLMISNHFPSTYSQSLNWAVLFVFLIGGALVRHFMNIRFVYEGWFFGAAGTIVVSLAALVILTKPKAPPAVPYRPVTLAEAQTIVQKRCVQCHADAPTDDVFKIAPNGIKLETAAQMKALAPRIRERAALLKTMPLANKTGITDEERAILGAWVDQGAQAQ
ncbi:MAG: urate hydroxylase PuuD [Polyangiales bacterium]